MKSTFKPHNVLVRVGQWPSSPLRVLRRELLTFSNLMAYEQAVSDVNFVTIQGNRTNILGFLKGCQVWFDFKDEMFKRFVPNGTGLIH